ncbi:hypothetical protein HYALB_00012008, partial [Hymenoscyphus albidus]
MAPCTRCEKSVDFEGRPRRCVAIPDSKYNRCAECSRQGKPCDYRERNQMPTLSDWASIEKQKERFEEEEERAAAQAQEAMARVARIRKQKRLLLAREKKMILAGLNSLDELDAAE